MNTSPPPSFAEPTEGTGGQVFARKASPHDTPLCVVTFFPVRVGCVRPPPHSTGLQESHATQVRATTQSNGMATVNYQAGLFTGPAIIQAQLVQGATPLPGVSTLTFALNVLSSSAGGGGSSSTSPSTPWAGSGGSSSGNGGSPPSPSTPVNDGLIIEASGKGYWAQCIQWGQEVDFGTFFASNLAVGIPLLTVFDSRFGIENIVAVYQSNYAPDAERYDDARAAFNNLSFGPSLNPPIKVSSLTSHFSLLSTSYYSEDFDSVYDASYDVPIPLYTSFEEVDSLKLTLTGVEPGSPAALHGAQRTYIVVCEEFEIYHELAIPMQTTTGTLTFDSTASGDEQVVIQPGNLPAGTLIKSNNSVIITAMRPGANRGYLVSLMPVEIDSRDRAVTGKIPHLGSTMGGNKKFEIGFQSGSKSLGKYEIPQSGSPQGVHIYNSEDEIFGPEETENLDGLSSEKKNQQVVLVREGSDIRFYTVSDDIGTFKVQLYLDGSLIGTVDHQLKAEDDFKRLITAVEGFVAGDAPPAIKAWEPWPNVTLPLPALPALADNQLNDTLGAAPAVVASEVPSIESLRDPEFFNAFVVRVRQVATESEWTAFVAQLTAIGYDANAALTVAAAGGSVYPSAGALKTELNLPPEIRNRGMVARVVIYWVKRAMKTQVATGEGVVFGLWDGVKGDAEGFVDMFRTLGQVFSSPWKTASELYHTFKSLKDLTFDQVKAKVQDLFDSFLANQQERMEWVLEGESSDPVYLGAYMGGYLGGYIGEQVLVTIGTAGLSKGKYIARAISKGKALLAGLNLTQKIPRNFNQVFSRYVRTADEGRGVSTFSNRCTNGNCFAPGTLVLMADGRSKVIEHVERGEWIITDDPNDNEPPKPAKVEWLIRNRTDRLYIVEWDRDGDGRTDAHVRTTSEHPFYALGRGWKPAKDLQPDDRIQTHQQRTVTITGNYAWIVPSATYNLDVGEPNTYFVGNSKSWLLVHNVEYEIAPWGIWSTPNQNHHGIMNKWLSEHFPTTYLGREWEENFPCVELTPENHRKADAIESVFRRAKGLPPEDAGWSWKDVTPQEAIKVMKDALKAAGAPDELWKVVLNQTNGWLKTNMHKWRCP